MDDPIDAIKSAIEFHVAGLTTEMQRLRSAFHLATKEDLAKAVAQIMATTSEQIKAYPDQVNAQLSSIETNVDQLVTSTQGVSADVAFIKAKLDAIQNSPGTLSPEDQASLDQASARTTAVADKLSGVAAQLKSLDEATDSSQQPEPPQPTPNA